MHCKHRSTRWNIKMLNNSEAERAACVCVCMCVDGGEKDWERKVAIRKESYGCV